MRAAFLQARAVPAGDRSAASPADEVFGGVRAAGPVRSLRAPIPHSTPTDGARPQRRSTGVHGPAHIRRHARPRSPPAQHRRH